MDMTDSDWSVDRFSRTPSLAKFPELAGVNTMAIVVHGRGELAGGRWPLVELWAR
jgi:hypothetical protein